MKSTSPRLKSRAAVRAQPAADVAHVHAVAVAAVARDPRAQRLAAPHTPVRDAPPPAGRASRPWPSRPSSSRTAARAARRPRAAPGRQERVDRDREGRETVAAAYRYDSFRSCRGHMMIRSGRRGHHGVMSIVAESKPWAWHGRAPRILRRHFDTTSRVNQILAKRTILKLKLSEHWRLAKMRAVTPMRKGINLFGARIAAKRALSTTSTQQERSPSAMSASWAAGWSARRRRCTSPRPASTAAARVRPRERRALVLGRRIAPHRHRRRGGRRVSATFGALEARSGAASARLRAARSLTVEARRRRVAAARRRYRARAAARARRKAAAPRSWRLLDARLRHGLHGAGARQLDPRALTRAARRGRGRGRGVARRARRLRRARPRAAASSSPPATRGSRARALRGAGAGAFARCPAATTSGARRARRGGAART